MQERLSFQARTVTLENGQKITFVEGSEADIKADENKSIESKDGFTSFSVWLTDGDSVLLDTHFNYTQAEWEPKILVRGLSKKPFETDQPLGHECLIDTALTVGDTAYLYAIFATYEPVVDEDGGKDWNTHTEWIKTPVTILEIS